VTRRAQPVEGIHDLVLLKLTGEDLTQGVGRVVALQLQDHLLRRFGQADLVRLSHGSELSRSPLEAADEVWVLVDGSVSLTWKDERTSSPTSGASATMAATEPVAVLVPFGVSFRIHAGTASILLRLATHSDVEIQGGPPAPVSTG
jgi:hypothetical protein